MDFQPSRILADITCPPGTGESKEERSKDATPLVKANMDRHMPE